mgnify:CR=1 FL=1
MLVKRVSNINKIEVEMNLEDNEGSIYRERNKGDRDIKFKDILEEEISEM